MLGREGKVVGEYQFLKYLSKDENDIETWAAINTNENNAKYRVLVASKEKLAEKEKQENFFGMKDIYMALQSDNILIPKDLIESKNNYYIVIQHMESPNLEEVLKMPANRSGLTVEKTLKYLRQLLEAVIHINSNGIYHRGITPKAVYIEGEKLYLDGFLMSKKSDRPLQTLISAVPFTSPEVYTAMEYDSRIDIWGVGIVAYYMLYNRSPWGEYSMDPGRMSEQWKKNSGDKLTIPPKYEMVPDKLLEFLKRTIESDLSKRWDWPQLKNFLAELAANRIAPTQLPNFSNNYAKGEPARQPPGQPDPKKLNAMYYGEKPTEAPKKNQEINPTISSESNPGEETFKQPPSMRFQQSERPNLQKANPLLDGDGDDGYPSIKAPTGSRNNPFEGSNQGQLQDKGQMDFNFAGGYYNPTSFSKQPTAQPSQNYPSTQNYPPNMEAPQNYMGSYGRGSPNQAEPPKPINQFPTSKPAYQEPIQRQPNTFNPSPTFDPPKPATDSRSNTKGSGGIEFVAGKSRLAPLYKNMIYETATKIDDFCTNDVLNDQHDDSIEMVFRLLLIVSIKLYLQVMKQLEGMPIDNILEASASSIPKKSEADKEAEKLIIQRNSLRMMWRNNIKYLNSNSIQSTIGGDEELLKSTLDKITEPQLRKMGKGYLLKVFRKYTLKNDRLNGQDAEKAEDMITSVYVMLNQEFDKDHTMDGREGIFEMEKLKLEKRALPTLVKEINSNL
jgi:serine/threonine protein kinase